MAFLSSSLPPIDVFIPPYCCPRFLSSFLFHVPHSHPSHYLTLPSLGLLSRLFSNEFQSPAHDGTLYLVQATGLSHKCITYNHIFFQERRAECDEQSTPRRWFLLSSPRRPVGRWRRHHRACHLRMRPKSTTSLQVLNSLLHLLRDCS